jgi:hypothetical protein
VKADCYVMKSILHDWNDQRCITILTHLRASMPPGSVLVNFDRLLPDCGTPGFHPAKAMDINMMVSWTDAPASRGTYISRCMRLGCLQPTVRRECGCSRQGGCKLNAACSYRRRQGGCSQLGSWTQHRWQPSWRAAKCGQCV